MTEEEYIRAQNVSYLMVARNALRQVDFLDENNNQLICDATLGKVSVLFDRALKLIGDLDEKTPDPEAEG